MGLAGSPGFCAIACSGSLFWLRNGVQRRMTNEKAILMEQIALQLEWTYKDMEAGRYENAKARLEYIIDKYPNSLELRI